MSQKKPKREPQQISLTVLRDVVRIAIEEDSRLERLWVHDDPVRTPDLDMDTMVEYLIQYWSAVSEVFADYWGKPIRGQRLTHATGLYAMTRLMRHVMDDVIVESGDWRQPQIIDKIKEKLGKISNVPWDHPNLLSLRVMQDHKEALYTALLNLYKNPEVETMTLKLPPEPITIPLKKKK